MEHDRRPREIAALNALQEVAFVQEIRDFAVDQVAELVRSPRSFNALTRLEPMNPAAPVTTIMMSA
jgi:hypothetical protein